MAENKKSFLLYSDLSLTVNKLPDETAGKLFKIILDYVNDKDPIVNDLLLEIAFEPIKQQLKRDLVTYEAKRKQWSDAGKRSADAKKAAKDSLNENQQTSTTLENVVTDSTVNVNVNVNDNVNVTTLKEKGKTAAPLSLIKIEKFKERPCPNRTDALNNAWEILVNEPKWKKKTTAALSATLKKLEKFNEQDALQMVENAIAGGWQGVHPIDKNTKNEDNGMTNYLKNLVNGELS